MILPLAASVIVMLPEFVPPFVSKIKSCAPLEVSVAFAAPVPICISPVPFGLNSKLIFESSPTAPISGPDPVAAFVISTWFTADPVVSKIIVHFHFRL